MRREFMEVNITCGGDIIVSATWSRVSGFSPYHGAFRLLRQVNEEMQQVLRSSFDRGLKRCDIEIDDLDRHGIDVMAQIVKLEETSGAAGGVMFTSFGACGMKGCRWVFGRWDESLECLLRGEMVALLVTAGGVTTVVQTVDGDAAELVRRLFDWMEDESE